MNILEFEEYLLDKNFNNNNDFLEDLKLNFKEELNLIYPNENRKLTDEETVYDYFDDSIATLFESLEQEEIFEKEEEHSCACGHCTCDENHSHAHHHSYHKIKEKKQEKKEIKTEEDLEKRFLNNIKLVYKLALYLLRDGIHYDDLAQEGLLGLAEANNLYKSNKEFDLYKIYFIVWEMFKHIKAYSDYRILGFKQYVETEKNKPKKVKISLKSEDKEKVEELKKLEAENKIKHKENIIKLETISQNIFGYFNLKYRLSLREVEVLKLYFGLDGKERKNFTDIENIMSISSDDVDKLLRESLYKLSVTDEKVEL